MRSLYTLTLVTAVPVFLLGRLQAQPNILIVLADDLGVNDVSWNNPAVREETPSLEKLAKSGVILDTAYTLPVCSPSRAALFTGIQPYKFGFQVQSPTLYFFELKITHREDLEKTFQRESRSTSNFFLSI